MDRDPTDFNNALIRAVVDTGWFPPGQSAQDRDRQIFVSVTSLMAFKPADEIEGMLAAQLMAMHHASMECSRRAMVQDQPYEFAQGFRKAAANASRTFVELLAALDRKRGKGGQQVVRVEHVHVHSGGQAIVGNIATSGHGGGGATSSPGNPATPTNWRMTLCLAQSSPRCCARTRRGTACQAPAMPNRRCYRHGGASTGPRTAEGIERIRQARTIHGRHSKEMIELRRAMALLRRAARQAIAKV